jgi:DNA-binding transcriptional LysR family regulator
VLGVGKEHKLAKRPSVGAEELAEERILTRTHCEHLSEISGFLKGHQCEDAPRHQVGSEPDVVTLLEANLGVAILPASTAKSDSVKLVPINDLGISRTVSVYGVAGRQRSTAATTLIKMLRAADWSRYENAAETVSSAKA